MRGHVLMIEDDRDLSEVTRELLASEGWRVSVAFDGAHALELLDGGLAPDVIVCDMMMPVMDGFGFLAAFGRRPAPRAPVLAVSALEPYLAQAARAGADAILAKPYRVDAFLGAVEALRERAALPPSPRPAPRDERARLDAVLRLRLDRELATADLDRFTERVARVFEVPISLVSIVTADRQHWHAACGLPDDLARTRATPRSASFCTHAVASSAALVVQDACENPFFKDNDLVRTRGLRFYAGVPVFSRSGDPLGTLCLLDFAPRRFDHFDLDLLGVLARRVAAEFEHRDRAARPLAPHASYRHLDEWDPELNLLGRAPFTDALLVESLRAIRSRTPLAVAVAVVDPEALATVTPALQAAFPRAHAGRLAFGRVGLVVPGGRAEELARAAETCGPGCRIEARDVPLAPGSARATLRELEDALGEAGLA